jgi:1-acyl-sn-glycerol-3-phosphate acyltransferase
VAEWTRTYRFAMSVMRPFAAWGRLEVEGAEALPEDGPVLLAGNHDSYYDPVMIGFAARRRRQVHALAKAELWKVPVLSKVLDGMGQIPIDRGAGDAHALDRAIEALRAGTCIGVFPEGTRSRGEELRARSGIGRLALAVPEAKLVLVAIAGTTEFVGAFPRRPTVRARFFEPAGGQTDPGESPEHLAARLLAEIRAEVPVAALGRPRRNRRSGQS